MQNISFMREVLLNSDKKVSLILTKQKQSKPSIDYILENLLKDEGNFIIYVTTIRPGQEVLEEIPIGKRKRVFVVDAFSHESSYINGVVENFYFVENPSNLTKIQIGIEKASLKATGKKIIILDSLSMLAIYSDIKNLERFVYLFSNKTKLNNNTAFLFATVESFDEESLVLIKQFCSKVYDFSKVFIESVELAH